MDPLLLGGSGIIVVLALLAIGVPIAFGMLVVGFLGLIIGLGDIGQALDLFKITPYHATAGWLFTVVPMFILMGHFAHQAGIITDLFNMFSAWIGRLRGSLALVTVATSAVFAFATGSTLAATAVIGKTMLPEMSKHGYSRRRSLGTVVAGGTLGNMIPPSIGLVLFGIITETSIGRLLIGGIVPGLILAAMFSIVITGVAVRNPDAAPRPPAVSWGTRFASLKNVWGMILLIIIVLGSIYTGLAMVTEAAGIGAFGAFIIALSLRRLSWGKLRDALVETGITTGVIFILLVAIGVFSRFLAFAGVTRALTIFVMEAGIPPMAVLGCVYLIYIFFGCIMEPNSLMLLITPIVFPIMMALGFDPIWFGVMTVIMIQIGFMTPPVGMGVYVLKSVSDASLEEIFASIIPFLACWLIAVVLFTIWPQILLWLPGMM